MIQVRKLSLEEYKNYMSQQFWLASVIEPVLILAANRMMARKQNLNQCNMVAFLHDHSNEEKGHQVWALNDLGRLNEKLQPTKIATVDLIERLYEIATSKKSYLILGICLFVENFSAGLSVSDIVPKEALKTNAIEFLVNHFDLDKGHAEEVNKVYESLPLKIQKEIDKSKEEFEELYNNFLTASIL